jgi:hypothetical protein
LKSLKSLGAPAAGCTLSTQKSLSFVTSESFVKLPKTIINDPPELRTLMFSFRTFEKNGLLVLSSGAYLSNLPFFGAEIVGGKLNALLRLRKGELITSSPFGPQLSNGDWHIFKLSIDKNGAKITVDNTEITMEYKAGL